MPVADLFAEGPVLGDEQEAGPAPLLVFFQDVQHLHLGDHIQHAGGLVQHDEGGLQQQDPGQRKGIYTQWKRRKMLMKIEYYAPEPLVILHKYRIPAALG